MARNLYHLLIPLVLCTGLLPFNTLEAVHMLGCLEEEGCCCDEVLSLDAPTPSHYTQEDYYRLLFDIGGWLSDMDEEYKEHSLFCPQIRKCGCPEKTEEKTPIQCLRNKKPAAICIENHAVEALKYALRSRVLVFQKSSGCEKVSDLLSGTSLSVGNLWDFVVTPLQSIGYEFLAKWLDNQLVPEVDCTQLSKEMFLLDVMEQAAVSLSLDGSPTRYREAYQTGRCLFIYLHCVTSKQYFFIDFMASSVQKGEERVGYVLSFPAYKEAVTFDSWENLKAFVDAYLLAQLVFCMDFYLFERPNPKD